MVTRKPAATADLVIFASIGRALHNARKDLGLEQQEVAQRAGITQAMLSGYENGAVMSLPVLDKLMVALELDCAKLGRYLAGRTGREAREALDAGSAWKSLIPLLFRAAKEEGVVDEAFLKTLLGR